MNKYFKTLGLLTLLLVSLVVPSVMASSEDLLFNMVKINGDYYSGHSTLFVERGETLDLRVGIYNNGSTIVDDLHLVAWIGGYEGPEEIRVRSDIFYVRAESHRVLDLELALPHDLETGVYDLHLEISNGNIKQTVPLTIGVDSARRQLNIVDVMFPTPLNAGDNAFVTVRVENVGSRTERNVEIEASIADLGVSHKVYIEELEASVSETSEILLLRLPKDAVTGDYDLDVKVRYNRGHTVVEETRTVSINGRDVAGPADSVEALVTVDTSSQSVVAGEEVVYKLTFANLGDETKLFSVGVAGTQLWADVVVDNPFVSVAPKGVEEVKLYLTAHDDADKGTNFFTLHIQESGRLVQEVVLSARVLDAEDSGKTAVSGELISASTLKIGFVGLVVLLVIFGLIIALKRLKDDDDYPLEPKDGQTYY